MSRKNKKEWGKPTINDSLEPLPQAPALQASVVVLEIKTAVDQSTDCTACAGLRKVAKLANSVTDIGADSDGNRIVHCNVCNTDRVVRRYDASLRQAENIAGPCPECSVEHPQQAQQTRVVGKDGRVRYCKCLRCKKTWKRIG
jgi:formate dehydrogenase maturation protein FdhE